MDNIIPLLRRERGIKQRDLARSLEVSPSFLCKVEKGLVEPTVIFMTSCAGYFNEPVDTVFPRETRTRADLLNSKCAGNNLWSVRRRKNIKQKSLADLIGCSPSYLSKVEKGQQIPNEHFRKKCARILKTRETELFPEIPAAAL